MWQIERTTQLSALVVSIGPSNSRISRCRTPVVWVSYTQIQSTTQPKERERENTHTNSLMASLISVSWNPMSRSDWYTCLFCALSMLFVSVCMHYSTSTAVYCWTGNRVLSQQKSKSKSGFAVFNLFFLSFFLPCVFFLLSEFQITWVRPCSVRVVAKPCVSERDQRKQ